MELRPAFSGKGFSPPPPRRSGDWLGRQHEPAQAFEDYVRSHPTVPTEERSTLALLVLGDISVSGELLREYVEAFFALPTVLCPRDASEGWGGMARMDTSSSTRHVEVSDALEFLRPRVPANAFALVAITEDSLRANGAAKIFGLSSANDRAALFTVGRSALLTRRTPRLADDEVALARYLNVVSHEVGHAFRLGHCVFFSCLMAGATEAEEAVRPMHLCPVCLRKLAWATRGNVVARYRKLARFYARYGIDGEAAWTAERLRELSGTPGS